MSNQLVYRYRPRSHAPQCRCPRWVRVQPPKGDWGIIGPGLLIIAVVAVIGFWPAMVWHGYTDTGGWRWDIHSTIAELVYWGIILAVVITSILARANSPEIRTREEGRRQADEDAREATRRNDEQQCRVQEAMSHYLAEFRAQGYAAEAAEALARKRLRDEGPSHRLWHASDIENERREAKQQREAAAVALEREHKEAERQRKIATGDLARCPRCQKYAPASQAIILAHLTGSQGKPCEGEGTLLKDA